MVLHGVKTALELGWGGNECVSVCVCVCVYAGVFESVLGPHYHCPIDEMRCVCLGLFRRVCKCVFCGALSCVSVLVLAILIPSLHCGSAGFETDGLSTAVWPGGETEALTRLERHLERKVRLPPSPASSWALASGS